MCINPWRRLFPIKGSKGQIHFVMEVFFAVERGSWFTWCWNGKAERETREQQSCSLEDAPSESVLTVCPVAQQGCRGACCPEDAKASLRVDVALFLRARCAHHPAFVTQLLCIAKIPCRFVSLLTRCQVAPRPKMK